MPGKSKLACHYGPTNSFVVATPIGDMCLVSCPKGLHVLKQADSICDENFCPDTTYVLIKRLGFSEVTLDKI